MSPTLKHLFDQLIIDTADHGLVMVVLRGAPEPFVGKVSQAHSAGGVYRAIVPTDARHYDADKILTTMFFAIEDVLTFAKATPMHLDNGDRKAFGIEQVPAPTGR